MNESLVNEPFPDSADSRAFLRAKRRRILELTLAIATGIGFCVMFGAFYSILTQ